MGRYCLRRFFKVERSQVAELDSEKVASSFPPIVTGSIDERIVVTITYKSGETMKSITLQENDSSLRLEDKANLYPQALIKLLKLNYKIAGAVRLEAQ
jgi:hypothetical protein